MIVLTVIPISIQGKVGIKVKTVDVPKETWKNEKEIKYDKAENKSKKHLATPHGLQILSKLFSELVLLGSVQTDPFYVTSHASQCRASAYSHFADLKYGTVEISPWRKTW